MGRRPKSVAGLSWRLARRRPMAASILALGIVGALALVSSALAGPTPASPTLDGPAAAPRCEPSGTDWRYGQWHYDYLEALALGEGSGSYVLGYGQAVRVDMTFRHRIEGDQLRLFDIVDHDGDGRHPREGELRTRFAVEEGDFRFAPDHPYDDTEEYRYRCRLVLDDFDGRRVTLYGQPTAP